MQYADYTFYSEIYGGSAVSEQEFARLAAEASAYIDRVTFDRAAEHRDDSRIKMCCCALTDIIQSTADTGGMVKQSESIGSWSYSLNSAAANATLENILYSKCKSWLPAAWLYRGVAAE